MNDIRDVKIKSRQTFRNIAGFIAFWEYLRDFNNNDTSLKTTFPRAEFHEVLPSPLM